MTTQELSAEAAQPEPVAAQAATATSSGPRHAKPRQFRRWIPAIVVAAGLAVFIATVGLPVDQIEVMLWCCVLAIALAWNRPGGKVLSAIADWAPVALVLVAYDFARGAADSLGVGINYHLAPRLDHWLTGTIPTVWLQNHLYSTSFHHWWNVPLSLLYVSHFLLPFIILSFLWAKSRQEYRRYVRRFLVITSVALVLFILHPTAPPWLAARHHVVGPVTRTASYGFAQIHLHPAVRLIEQGRATVNAVAAFPSLHAAYSALPLVFFWPTSRNWLRGIAGLYAVAMGFMLVATGEHWVSDVLAGWILTGGVCVAFNRYESRKREPNSS